MQNHFLITFSFSFLFVSNRVAIATYNRQLKDSQTMRSFLGVKRRASQKHRTLCIWRTHRACMWSQGS